MEEMSNLASTWLWYASKRKPERVLETPTEAQAEVLTAFGWRIGEGGVLHRLDG